MTNPSETPTRTGLEIAVIGMTGRFPGAPDVTRFWENLIHGVEAVEQIPDDQIRAAGIDPFLIDNPRYVKLRVQEVENSDCFDASFFDYTPLEAQLMDPQIRLLHEVTWAALEDAAYDPATYKGLIGVYAGSPFNVHWEMLARLSGKTALLGDIASLHLINKDFMVTRVSYKLDLRGPSVSVQAACATSLLAIHMACRALLTGECQMAVAGGITIDCQKNVGYLYQEGMAYSSDGHCKAFDIKADGTIFGSGAGMVVLKPLKAALANRDHIYAIIKGSAINNDGIRKVGYIAPSVIGQAEVVRAAHSFSRVEPESIGYIEPHGTGTALGDPIEFEGLKKAFATDKKGFCALGGIKTNVGHLDSAAGVTGFIAAVLVLQNRLIPPRLNYSAPNPILDIENTPFYITPTLKEWKRDKYPLRAGVSAFGVGGTNAHIVLEEAPEPENAPENQMGSSWQLILLSAKSPAALDRATTNLAAYLLKNPAINFHDLAYTLQVGRHPFEHRAMTVSRDIKGTIQVLPPLGNPYIGTVIHAAPALIFMFSGQGSQYVNMGKDLYLEQPDFREELDRCFAILTPLLGFDPKSILYPDPQNQEGAAKKLSSILYGGPIKFAFEYAMTKLLMKWGLQPRAMIGHSFGEYVVAQLAGVFTLEDGLALSVLRGKLMDELLPPGAMTTVQLPEAELKTLLLEHNLLSIAAVNAPALCIVAGPVEAVQRFEQSLKEKGAKYLRLSVSGAGHCHMMTPMLEAFEAQFRQVTLHKPQIPYISCLTGQWVTENDATRHGYWVDHLLHTVRFGDGLTELLKIPGAIFIQVGSGTTLPSFVNQCLEAGAEPGKEPETLTLNLVRHLRERVSDMNYLLTQMGRLWVHGLAIDWTLFHTGQKRCRLSLPTYPFERTRYWLDVAPSSLEVARAPLSPATSLNENPQPKQEKIKPSFYRKPGLAAYAPPVSPMSHALTDIWQKLFGFEPIGSNDNFFTLGGDSLKAINVISYITKELHVEIPLKEFFNKPTIAEISDYLAAQSPENSHVQTAPIEAVEEKEYYVLSSAQKRIYILMQLEPDSIAYNIPLVIVLTGEIDRQKVVAVFKELIRRHDSLRTSFTSIHDEPVQVVHRDVEFIIQHPELAECHHTPAEVVKITNHIITPFDLSVAPLIRVCLVKESPARHVLVVDMHHIVSDGYTAVILWREFWQLYRGETLSPLRIQYKDFSEWKNSTPQRENLKKQERYWLQVFAGELPQLNIHTDYPRPEIKTYDGSTFDFEIGPEHTRAIKSLATQEKCTVFTVMLAIYYILLAKLSHSTDIIVGSAIEGRVHPDLRDIVGMFINMLALRNFPTGEKTFRFFLEEVRNRVLEDFMNQDYPFEHLVEKLQIKRQPGRNPLLDVGFQLLEEGENPDNSNFPDLTDDVKYYERTVSKVDMIFYGTYSPDKLSFIVEYCTRLFTKQTIQNIATYYATIVSIVLEDPDIPIENIEIISQQEKKRLFSGMNEKNEKLNAEFQF